MAVIRRPGGDLLVWSPVALTPELSAAVDELGAVRDLIAPNTLHYRYLAAWQHAYPDARTHAPADLRSKLPGLTVDCVLGDVPPEGWIGDIDQVIVRGNRITTEVVFFHKVSRTTIIADLVQHFESDWFTGWRALVARVDLMTGSMPTVPRKFRLAFTDRKAAREAVQHILAWPTEQVLLAHGEPVRCDGRLVLAHAFDWLLRGR